MYLYIIYLFIYLYIYIYNIAHVCFKGHAFLLLMRKILVYILIAVLLVQSSL